MYKFILILSLLFFASYCSEKPEKQPLSSVLETATVELSEVEKCVIALHHERGLEGDKCIVDCMINGEGRNVGGGCYHMCFAYSDIEWHELPETEKCYSDSTIGM
tara:strand:- start:122 stop:436 length:315 start_codon:yes stop_codon:yes gene_type:complete